MSIIFPAASVSRRTLEADSSYEESMICDTRVISRKSSHSKFLSYKTILCVETKRD